MEIVNIIESLGSDNLDRVGGLYEGGISLQQVPIELAKVIYKIKNHHRRVTQISNFLEIGSASGGNAYVFNLLFDLDNIVLVDNNKLKKSRIRKDVLKGIDYSQFIGNSHSKEVFNLVKGTGIKFDILFIDGDHTYEGVKQDMEMYGPLVDYEGFIIFHDTVAVPAVRGYMKELYQELYNGNPKDLTYLGEFVAENHPKCGLQVFQTYRLIVR